MTRVRYPPIPSSKKSGLARDHRNFRRETGGRSRCGYYAFAMSDDTMLVKRGCVGRSIYDKPKGTPASARYAYGPYATKAKATKVAKYQSHGGPVRFRGMR